MFSKSLNDALKGAPGMKVAPDHAVDADTDVAVEFDHVTKTYHLYKNDVGRFLGIFNIQRPGVFLGDVDANKDLSFTVKKGEAVAFLGHNGAGKSTALKMVTGVIYPTSGRVTVNGRVSALLELTAGFDGQLTGRENIKLRGQIMGLTTEQIAAIEPNVIEFADLGVYIDQPIRMYSSGMKSRLGFAFAVASDPDILIVDETLSVGDKEFKKKCLTRVREIVSSEGVTVLFVTHTASMAKEFCTRGIVLDHGQKVFEGTIGDAIDFYDRQG